MIQPVVHGGVSQRTRIGAAAVLATALSVMPGASQSTSSVAGANDRETTSAPATGSAGQDFSSFSFAPATNNSPSTARTPADIDVFRRIFHEELQQIEDQSERKSRPWKVLALATSAIALLSLWRWRYRVREDFASKQHDIGAMQGKISLDAVTFKLVMVLPKVRNGADGSSKHLMVIDDPRMGNQSSFDPKVIFGPYVYEQLQRASTFCTPEDPLVLNHIDRIKTPWQWKFDALVRFDFKAFVGLMTKKLTAAEVIQFRLRRMVESLSGERVMDVLDGRPRELQYFLSTILCDVQPNGQRLFLFPVFPSSQFKLFGDRQFVERLKRDNPDMARDVDLFARAFEAYDVFQLRKAQQQSSSPAVRGEAYSMPQGHPRLGKTPGGVAPGFAEIPFYVRPSEPSTNGSGVLRSFRTAAQILSGESSAT